MKQTLLLGLASLTLPVALTAQTVFLNEIDYDQPQTDNNEFVEVGIDLSSCAGGCDPSLVSVIGYRENGTQYGSRNYGGGSTNTDGPNTLLLIPFSGLQNGRSGLAVLYDGVVTDFLSFELPAGATITATDGDAAGATTTANAGTDNGGTVNTSLQRRPDGSFEVATPTPGVANNTPVPVRLVSFEATSAAQTAVLAWTTASELDNAYFGVEVSRDGATFEEVAQVSGNGTTAEASDYRFTYRAEADGRHYFRLVQVDFDGARTASQVVSAQLGDLRRGISALKQSSDEIAFDFSGTAADAEVRVIDLRGVTLLRTRPAAGRNVLDVSTLSAGVYLISDGDSTLRFVRP